MFNLIDWFQAEVYVYATLVVLLAIPIVILIVTMAGKSKKSEKD